MEPRVIADYLCNTGEGPTWHPEESAVYWTDIPNGKLFKLDWPTGEHRRIYAGEPVGGMTLQEDGSLVLFKARGAIELYRDGVTRTLLESLPGEEDNRFNDVIATPNGSVFAGTMSTPDRQGKLYRIDPDMSVSVVVENVGCSNGMGFSGDRKLMYYVDSTARLVSVFDFNETTSEISNRRAFLDNPDAPGGPDGMTVDAEDYVWVAYWNGNQVIRYDPSGREVTRVPFPAKKVSCITFGGPSYDDAFVTTAGGDAKIEDGEGAGALFHLSLGVRGRPEFRSRLGVS